MKTDGTDSFKLEVLKEKLRKERNKKPSHVDVMRILQVSYPQAGRYLRAFKNGGV